MFTLTEENFKKIKEIDEASEEGFQEIFENFLDDAIEGIKKDREAERSLPKGDYLSLSHPQDFRFSNPRSALIAGESLEAIPMPPYLRSSKSWARIFHVFLTKIKERHGHDKLIPALKELGINAVQGNNASVKTRTTVGGYTSYVDLGLAVELQGGQEFQPALQKIAERELISYTVTVSWQDRETTPDAYRGKTGKYSFTPSN